MAATVFCSQCGLNLDAGDAFCKRCGANQAAPKPISIPMPTQIAPVSSPSGSLQPAAVVNANYSPVEVEELARQYRGAKVRLSVGVVGLTVAAIVWIAGVLLNRYPGVPTYITDQAITGMGQLQHDLCVVAIVFWVAAEYRMGKIRQRIATIGLRAEDWVRKL